MRTIGTLFLACCVYLLTAIPPTHAQEAEFPAVMTGPSIPSMASFDQLIPELMARWEVPGASVAVTKDERLVFARGYGYADLEKREPVQPGTLFRIASISKSITATTVLQLVEDGRLKLDQKVLEILTGYEPLPGEKMDPRWKDITVGHLLNHTGGWDRWTSFDPVDRMILIAETAHTTSPPTQECIVRYMLGQPLQFNPGTKFGYSNFGYILLGKIIEKVSGEDYESYVTKHVLRPAGIKNMHLARSLLADKYPDEAHYYAQRQSREAPSVFDPLKQVPYHYGGSCMEVMGANCGWVASAVDLVRFATAVDGNPGRPDVLDLKSIQLAESHPPRPMPQNTKDYYGYGWTVQRRGRETNIWHGGGWEGTASLLVRMQNGFCYAILMNSRAAVPGFTADVDRTMLEALKEVEEIPDVNFFSDSR